MVVVVVVVVVAYGVAGRMVRVWVECTCVLQGRRCVRVEGAIFTAPITPASPAVPPAALLHLSPPPKRTLGPLLDQSWRQRPQRVGDAPHDLGEGARQHPDQVLGRHLTQPHAAVVVAEGGLGGLGWGLGWEEGCKDGCKSGTGCTGGL